MKLVVYVVDLFEYRLIRVFGDAYKAEVRDA